MAPAWPNGLACYENKRCEAHATVKRRHARKFLKLGSLRTVMHKIKAPIDPDAAVFNSFWFFVHGVCHMIRIWGTILKVIIESYELDNSAFYQILEKMVN